MKRISDNTTNRIIAFSAILISAASFYVAVLQTRASQQQVKAETWPYLQIDNGNYDLDNEDYVINYTLVNAGVGPARVATMQLIYEGEVMRGFYNIVERCCKDLITPPKDAELTSRDLVGNIVTANPSPLILPSEGKVHLFLLSRDEINRPFWERINKVRNQLTARACYCSVLDECFETNFIDEPEPVDECRSDLERDYRG